MSKYILYRETTYGDKNAWIGDTVEDLQEQYKYSTDGDFRNDIEDGTIALHELGPQVELSFKIEIVKKTVPSVKKAVK